MNYDFERLIAVIAESTTKVGPIKSRMLAVIDECDRQAQHQDWAIFKTLDYQVDIGRLGQWISKAVDALPDSAPPRGLWVGICNPCDDPNDMSSIRTDVYMSLCSRFEESSNDWAREPLVTTECLRSEVLRALYKTAYSGKGSLEDSAEYPVALAYGAMLTVEALSYAPTQLFSSLEGAVCGFDSGDSLLVGTVADGAFRRSVRPL